MLENARRVFRIGRALTGVQLAIFGDVHRFARRQVTNQGETQYVQRNAFGGDHVLDAFVGMTLTEDNRTDGVRVAEADNPVTGDHGHYGVATTAAIVNVGDGSEDVFFSRLQLATHRQLMSEDVQQHFRIGTGVDMTQIGFVDFLGQLFDVGQVTVVRQRNAVRRVDIERLSLGRGRAARSRVAHMTNTHMPHQALHVALLEHITHQAIVLAQK